MRCLSYLKGYNLANNTEDTAFAHMAKFPNRVDQFARAMSLFSMGPGYSLNGFWRIIPGKTFVQAPLSTLAVRKANTA